LYGVGLGCGWHFLGLHTIGTRLTIKFFILLHCYASIFGNSAVVLLGRNISHSVYWTSKGYKLYIIQFFGRLPAYHDGSHQNSIQNEIYTLLTHALWNSLLHLALKEVWCLR
jgi:hypothetical protein